MQATHHGGLNGKARFLKNRNRAERIRAQQLLDEYFGADEEPRPRRHVRLGSRAEFLPSADSWTALDAALDAGHQFELSLAPPSPVVAVADSTEPAKQTPTPTGDAVRPAVTVIPAPYWARPKVAFQPQGRRNAPPAFDPRRFLYGCALGTAAAAAILVAVSAVFH
jgi:hypothetical protein